MTLEILFLKEMNLIQERVLLLLIHFSLHIRIECRFASMPVDVNLLNNEAVEIILLTPSSCWEPWLTVDILFLLTAA